MGRTAKPIPFAAEPRASRGQGLAEPMEAWAVKGLSGSESRFDAVRAARMTGFVGCEQDIDGEFIRAPGSGDGLSRACVGPVRDAASVLSCALSLRRARSFARRAARPLILARRSRATSQALSRPKVWGCQP